MFKSDISNLSRHSHAKIEIECSKQVVDKCIHINRIEYRDAMNNIERNNGYYICLYCSRHLKYSGERNPNNKYKFDRTFFNDIDNENKAYLLGWIASDGCVSQNNSIYIKIHKKDINCLERLRNIICEELPIKPEKEDTIKLAINSKNCCQDICKHLQINPGKKDDIVRLPKLSDELTWVFLRGYFEGDGNIRNHCKKSSPECKITSNSKKILEDIQSFVKIPCVINNIDISFYGKNCIDFLSKIYYNCNNNFLYRKYDEFLYWSLWQPKINGKNTLKNLPECRIFKTDINAVLPYKTNFSDLGYNLSIIKEYKKINDKLSLYDTGLKISVKKGLYAEIVPKNFLNDKSGYIFNNSIGIVDYNYHGNLLVSLYKIDNKYPNIKFPFNCFQLIFKKNINIDVETVSSLEDLSSTSRGDGGFGSTGVN